MRFHILSSTIQVNSDKNTLGYSPFFTLQTQKHKSSKNPKATHQPTPNPSALGTHHGPSRTYHHDSPRTSFVPPSVIYLLFERYVYKNVLVVFCVARNGFFFFWLLFKNENYKRISQDSFLLLNKTHFVAEMSLDLSSNSTNC